LKEQFEVAQQEITTALREGFAEIVGAMVDRLTVAPGEKQKIFRDSLVENFSEFFNTFNQRNIMEDADLASVVEKAKALLAGVTPDKLRSNSEMREKIRTDMQSVKASLDTMLVERASRKFTLEE